MLSKIEPSPLEATARFARYTVYGVTLLSRLRLNLPLAAGPSHQRIILDTAGPEAFRSAAASVVPDPDGWYAHAVLGDGSLYMRWEDWFEFLVSSDGALVRCRNLSAVALDSFEAYLTNFAVSAALLQHGEEPLHATVVEIDGRAIGLIGQSGAGQSTLAAYLIGQGASLVTDDMLRLTFEGGCALAHTGPQRLKLFEEPASRFLRNAIGRGRFNPHSGKFLFEPGNSKAGRPALRLAALFHLDWPSENDPADGVRTTQLTGGELFTAITASTMNSRIHLAPRLERQFRFAERLARTVPVHRLSYPRRYEVIGRVAALIRGTAPS